MSKVFQVPGPDDDAVEAGDRALTLRALHRSVDVLVDDPAAHRALLEADLAFPRDAHHLGGGPRLEPGPAEAVASLLMDGDASKWLPETVAA